MLHTRIEKPEIAGDLDEVIEEVASSPLPPGGINEDSIYQNSTGGVIERGIVAVLTREKNELLAALRRTDADSEPEAYVKLQKQLVALEVQRREITDKKW